MRTLCGPSPAHLLTYIVGGGRLPDPQGTQAALRDDGGSLIAFPYMPRVAQLSRGWRRWSPAEKIEHLLGMCLDQAHSILSWPVAELDPPRLAVQSQVRHIILMVGVKALLDGSLGHEAARECNRQRIIEELARLEFGTSNKA